MCALRLKDQNVLKPDTPVSLAQTSISPISIRCPHCRQIGSFQVVAQQSGLVYAKSTSESKQAFLLATLRVCPNKQCRGIVMAAETIDNAQQQTGDIIQVFPPELLDFSIDDLPAMCQATLKEAVACRLPRGRCISCSRDDGASAS